ncbi:MAG TPA: pyruvate, phosphate dikinase [Acidimicrobiia bacterium]|nr:pyruvate, phosphate dikinase [Acidimicrobiia bacterium]
MPHLYDFDQGDWTDRGLLGGKGAGLAEMTHLGLPVPPGFTITTEVCRHAMKTGELPADLWDEVDAAVSRLEEKSGRSFGGGGEAPLLLSVRSGAKFSMPGMMDTVLNIGVNDEVVEELIAWSGDPHFAWDVYRRFIQMYGDVVLGIEESRFQGVLTMLRARSGVQSDADLSAADLQRATYEFKAIVEEHRPGQLPSDPTEQLRGAVEAVFKSWTNKRAIDYRRIHDIPDDLGTAANVQMMVFGDLGEDSGTGVCFTRDPSSGARVYYGDYLPRAQGEDVVSGARNTLSLDALKDLHPDCHAELIGYMDRLEENYRDMMDIEFTIEKGKLFILQSRVGKRTPAAAVRIAVAITNEGTISKEEALLRVDPETLEQLHRPRVSPDTDAVPIATGVDASPGAAVGQICFSSDDAVRIAAEGKDVILVRPETTPDDIHGMAAAVGILTSQGGKTSHAAVVARGMGKPAVTGAAALTVDPEGGVVLVAGRELRAGDTITLDGTAGKVYVGEVDLVAPEPLPELLTLLEWADEVRQLGVRANADTPEDAAEARKRGAQGIGLARTEHMFMGERLQIVQRVILARSPVERQRALEQLETQQVDDFEAILEAMDGLPVVVRLLDPPLHEFLPSRLELEQEALRRVRSGRPIDELRDMSDQVARWEEDNPMLGLRGVRLGLVLPDLYRMQARAAINAICRRLDAGGNPHLEIMIPLVSTVEELRRMRAMIEKEIVEARERTGHDLEVPIGTMIELPRAALTADEIASVADFFSFGTNDLTQMTYGLSRDDAERLFLHQYVEEGILKADPFQTIDRQGVGRLVEVACKEGRAANPDLQLGVCGEHGGDARSIEFFSEVGLDYVSCSTFRVEGARLAAAQVAIRGVETSDTR